MEPNRTDPYSPEPGSSVFDDTPSRMIMASTGQRLANYLIDIIVNYAIVFGIIVALATVSDGFANWAAGLEYSSAGRLIDGLFTMLLFSVVYAVTEGATGGKTLGKLITGTRAVKEDTGHRITWRDAFLRSIIRAVPFEPFSGLSGYPWHDKWSHTVVAREDSLRPVH